MSTDKDKELKLRAVHVYETEGGSEYFEVGVAGITSVAFNQCDGPLGRFPTVQVKRDGRPHSIHPFHNVLGVYYAEPAKEDQS